MTKNDIMQIGIDEANRTMLQGVGGPFGAVVVRDGQIVCIASNTVLADNDPTAHAEMNAIRKACKKLNTYDLSDCELYATGYPCPMCLSAIIWANIKTVYVSGTVEDAEKIGFRDNYIYDYIKDNTKQGILNIIQLERQPAITLYDKYSSLNKTIY